MNTHPPIERSRIPPAVFILYLVFSSYFSKTQFHKSLIISPIFSPLSSHQQFFMAELPSTKQIIKWNTPVTHGCPLAPLSSIPIHSQPKRHLQSLSSISPPAAMGLLPASPHLKHCSACVTGDFSVCESSGCPQSSFYLTSLQHVVTWGHPFLKLSLVSPWFPSAFRGAPFDRAPFSSSTLDSGLHRESHSLLLSLAFLILPVSPWLTESTYDRLNSSCACHPHHVVLVCTCIFFFSPGPLQQLCTSSHPPCYCLWKLLNTNLIIPLSCFDSLNGRHPTTFRVKSKLLSMAYP